MKTTFNGREQAGEKVVAGGKHDGGRSLRPKWQFAASGGQAI